MRLSPRPPTPFDLSHRLLRRALACGALLLGALCAGAQDIPKPDRYPNPKRFQTRIELYTAQDKEAPPAPGGIVFTGGSEVTRWNKSLGEDFEGISVIGRGFGGSTVADNAHYAGQTVLPHKARQVVFYGGDTDISLGRTPEGLLEDFAAFVKAVHAEEPQTKILYLSLKPALRHPQTQPQIDKTNELIRGFCAANYALAYADISPALRDKDGSLRPDLYTEDGLHLSRDGQKAVAALITPLLLPEPPTPETQPEQAAEKAEAPAPPAAKQQKSEAKKEPSSQAADKAKQEKKKK